MRCSSALPAATIHHRMRTLKRIQIVLMALVLGAGMACAQVCNVSCALPDGLPPTPDAAQKPADQTGHCHQPPSAPQPQKSDHSSECLPHDYASATIKSGSSSLIEALQHGAALLAVLFQPAHASLDRLAGTTSQARSDRSPPSRAVFSILRI